MQGAEAELEDTPIPCPVSSVETRDRSYGPNVSVSRDVVRNNVRMSALTGRFSRDRLMLCYYYLSPSISRHI